MNVNSQLTKVEALAVLHFVEDQLGRMRAEILGKPSGYRVPLGRLMESCSFPQAYEEFLRAKNDPSIESGLSLVNGPEPSV
jgi:hypothetical protein